MIIVVMMMVMLIEVDSSGRKQTEGFAFNGMKYQMLLLNSSRTHFE